MTLEKAIQLLRIEFKKAKSLEWVHNPLAYALYQVWKKADAKKPTVKIGDASERRYLRETRDK